VTLVQVRRKSCNRVRNCSCWSSLFPMSVSDISRTSRLLSWLKLLRSLPFMRPLCMDSTARLRKPATQPDDILVPTHDRRGVLCPLSVCHLQLPDNSQLRCSVDVLRRRRHLERPIWKQTRCWDLSLSSCMMVLHTSLMELCGKIQGLTPPISKYVSLVRACRCCPALFLSAEHPCKLSSCSKAARGASLASASS